MDSQTFFVGQQIGRWTIVGEKKSNALWYAFWPCRCQCGTEKLVSQAHLRARKTNSCGCGRRKPKKARQRTPKNAAEVFLRNFAEKETSVCWEWNGPKTKKGYGRFCCERKVYHAHRFSYSHFKGELSASMHVHHTCFNRSCVNPDHLQALTHSEHSKVHSDTLLMAASRRRRNVRTHCRNGHPLSGDNLCASDLRLRGARRCKICNRAYMRELSRKLTLRKKKLKSAKPEAEREHQRKKPGFPGPGT